MKPFVLAGSVALALVLSGCGKSPHATETKTPEETTASQATSSAALPEMERNPQPVVSETARPSATSSLVLSNSVSAPSAVAPVTGDASRTIPQSSVLAAEMRARRQSHSPSVQAAQITSTGSVPALQPASSSLSSGSAGSSSAYSPSSASPASGGNTASSGGVLTVSIPSGTAEQPVTVPAALAQPDTNTPANQAQLMDQLAEDFANSVSNSTNSTATTGGKSTQDIWNNAQWQSDEQFRRFFGQDAFLQYSKKAAASTETTGQGTN